MASLPRIAVIGAGPAGLTLARLLNVSKAKLDVTLFELDESPTSRQSQGGTLDLHVDTGLAAIRKCGLWSAFRKYARDEGDEFIMIDKNATKLVHMRNPKKQEESDRPEIDRHRLREILSESVPKESVKWGRHLREVTEDGLLRFDGIEAMEGPFDLVVGADGAWSKVRAKLNKVQPAYSGISGFEMDIMEPSKKCPHVDKMVGRGMFFGSSDSKFLNAQRMGNNSLKIRTWFACPENEAKETLEKLGNKGTLAKMLQMYAGWAPEMLELLRQGDLESLRQWTLHELPVGYKWEHKKGLTLIGDSASLSTPFSGEGVNKAMKDSLELAELIEKSQSPEENLTLDQAVLLYEQREFPRAEKLQSYTKGNKQNMFGGSAPIGIMTGQLKTMANESSSMLMKLAGTAPVLGALWTFFWVRIQIGWAVRTFWRRT